MPQTTLLTLLTGHSLTYAVRFGDTEEGRQDVGSEGARANGFRVGPLTY